MSIHHLQTWPDSCIAAAMCMIQRWRGEVPTEARFYQENSWFTPHYIIKTLPRITAPTVESDRNSNLRFYLQQDRVVVATALVQNYENWRSAAYPSLRSPHGTMSSLSSLWHMVVLVSGTSDEYHFFDPFYPDEAQPLAVSDDDFMRWFTGLVFVASR